MNKLKKLIMLFLAVAILPLTVSAADKLNLKVNKTDLKVGDEVVVSASITGKEDYYAAFATLKYDENVFEKIDDTNFFITENVMDVTYNKKNHKFAIINKNGKNENVLFMVSLKVKENANSGDTNIALTNISISDGDKEVNFPKVSKKVSVNGSNKQAMASNKITDDQNIIVKTFTTVPIIILLSIVAIILFIAIGYLYFHHRDKKKTINTLKILAILLVGIVLVLFGINYHKQDIDKDKNQDYNDSKKIVDYILKIEDSQQGDSAYDINNDGKINVKDVARHVKNLKKINYKVELKPGQFKYYYKKDENITLNFSAQVTNNVKIQEVYVNGKKYKVDGNYSVTIDATKKAGIHNFTISKVVLANGETVDTNSITFTVDILKEEPTVKTVSYDAKNQKLTVYNNDIDKALADAKIVIAKGKDVSYESVYKELYDTDYNNSNGNIDPDQEEQIGDSEIDAEIVYEKNLSVAKDENKLDEVKLQLGETYKIFVIGSYDLDSHLGDKNYYKSQKLYEKEYINGEVNITPINTLNYIEQNVSAQLQFEVNIQIDDEIMAQYLNQSTISKIVIDGITRDITYVDGHYVLSLNPSSVPDEKDHIISSLIFNDGTEILCNYNFKYEVLKSKPQFENFVYHHSSKKITFTLNDKDKALKDGNVVITKEGSNTPIFEHKIDASLINFEYKTDELEEGNHYTVKLEGKYDLDSDDTNEENEGNIQYEQRLTVHDVKLTAVDDTYFAQKGSEVELKFNAKITPQDDEDDIITDIVINGETINNPTLNADGSYSVKVTAPAEAGVKDYEISKVTLGNDEINTNSTFKVDVLKDKPIIENFYIDESREETNIPEIKFNLVDNDSALNIDNSGKIVIKDEEKKTISTNNFSGNGDISLDLNKLKEKYEEGKTYYLDILLNYDLDSDNKNGKNAVTNEVVENYQDKEFKIYTASLQLASEDNLYFEKAETKSINVNASISPASDWVNIGSFIMADGEDVPAILNDGNLAIQLTAPENYHGLKTYQVKKVVLTNDVKIKAPLEIPIDVLRDVPYINNLNLSEDNKSISYELVDKDEAFKNGTITIYDKNNHDVGHQDVQSNNIMKYDFIDEEVYKVIVVGSYDLDTNKNDDNNSVTNKEMSTQTFMIGGAYNFEITDVSITDGLQPGENPVITFTSTNSRGAEVEKVTISGKEYDVRKVDDNKYEVVLTDVDTSVGKHEVTLEQVKLNTEKVYTSNDFKVNKLVYTVLKDAPKITEINLTGNNGNKTVAVNAKVNDDNHSLKGLKALLVDSTGKIIDTKEFTMEEYVSNSNNLGFTLSYDKNKDGNYTVKFVADYELGEKYKYNNQNIGENSIIIENKEIYIDDITFPKSQFAIKGQRNFQISYDVHAGESIKTNNNKRYSRLSGVMINGTHHISEGESTNKELTYKGRIAIVAPTESGIYTYTASRVQLELNQYYDKQTDYYTVPSKDIQIEVLKDKPTIKNLKIVSEDYDAETVTFEFDVKLDDKAQKGDNSFENGTIELNGSSQKIERDEHNKITFTGIQKDTPLDLNFKATYDLDTDTLDKDKDQNQYNNETFYTVKYGLYNSDTYKNIELKDGKAISKNDNMYFEKNEKIKLHFNIEGNNDVAPIKVKVKDKEYNLTKTDTGYEFTVDGYKTFGKKTIEISEITLENGKNVKLDEPSKINLVVLKDIPKIVNYKYELEKDKIKISLDLQDYDGAIVGKAKTIVTDEDGKKIYNEDLTDEFTFDYDEKNVRYFITVVADYDRDIDVAKGSANYFDNVNLLEETISFDKNYIELKDINDINLYKLVKNNDEINIELRDENVTLEEINSNKENYFVEINMENMPSVRTNIKKVEKKDGHLILHLDYEYVTKEEDKNNDLEIDFGEIKDGKVKNETHPDVAFNALLAKLEANQDVTLNQNYDASTISKEGITYISSYTGKLDGNGYTIENLSKPLFNDLQGTVTDLTIKNVTLDSNGKGALAIDSHSAKVSDVIVNNFNKTNAWNGNDRNGGLIGSAYDKTVIERCGVKNAILKINDAQQNGGLVGRLENSTIRDSYAIGTINGYWNFNGGLVGNAINSEITGSFAKVNVSGNTKCDFACTYNSASTYKNNISLSTGGSSFAGGMTNKSENNYYLTESETTTLNVKNIKKDDVNKDLFEQATFDSKIWRLNDKISYDNTPIFQKEKITDLKGADNEKFDESKITLYNNLMKLMPFYKADKIIELAEDVKDEDLKTKVISHILPVDSNGSAVTYITSDNLKKINKIKIVYNDDTKKEYKVNYDNTYDFVATYRIPSLKLDYNYNHYVINASSQIVNDLTNYLKGLDYTESLDTLTATADSRIYKDFYNDTTSKELKEFVLKYLSNSNFTNTTDSEEINAYLENSVKKDKNIEKVLYVYNYFRRFYDVEIDGMKLYDYMLFRMDDYDRSLTAEKITNLYLASDDNFKTSTTGTVYKNILSTYTGKDTIAKFIEHMVIAFGDGDLDAWAKNQFKGYLVEIPVKINEVPLEDVQYTLWDHFINPDIKGYKADDRMLPILTLPKNAAYIISTPVQFVIGAQRSYIDNPDDPTQQNLFQRRVMSYAKRMATYYDTAYKILGDATLFNNIHTWHHDVRYAYDENGSRVYQQIGTNEPFHKNFNEVTGYWQTSDGNAAVAWGDRIDWSAEGLLDGNIDEDLVKDLGKEIQEYTYHTFTHETAHNIDARLFLRNYGRRYDAGGEDYADSGFMQSFGPNDIVMNLSVDRQYDVSPSDSNWEVSKETGSSYTPKRIDSKDKIHDYYRKVFETIYVMDYIEAQAFLKLTPEQQAEIGIQVSYPNEDEKFAKDSAGNIIPDGKTYKEDEYARFRSRLRTGYSQMDASHWESLHLTSIDDLIDKKVMKYSGVYKYSSRGDNSYGGEGINTAHWYQPNNPYGRPDSYALKWIAYEMLGYKGYDEGFVEYYSNIHAGTGTVYKDLSHPENGTSTINNYKTDNMAIHTISGGLYNNIDDYKKARFKETGENLKHLREINVNEYAQKMYDALVKDAKEMKQKVDQRIKNAGSEQNCLNGYWCVRGLAEDRGYANSTRVRQELYYTLKHLTNDFEGEIYSNDINNKIEFNIKTHDDATD